MDNLKFIIKTKYGSIIKFATEGMGMQYETFNYNVRHKRFDYKQIKKMLDLLGIKFEDLQEFAPVKAQTETQPATAIPSDNAQQLERYVDVTKPGKGKLFKTTTVADMQKPNPPLAKKPVIVTPEPEVVSSTLQAGESLSDFMARQAAANQGEEDEPPPGFLEGDPMAPKYGDNHLRK